MLEYLSMRIGLITHNYPASKDDRQNAGIFVYDIAHAIQKLGHQVFVLCLDAGGKSEKDVVPVTWFSPIGGKKKLGQIQFFNPLDWVLFFSLLVLGFRATSRFCKDYKIDFCIAMWAFPAGVFALWANIVKMVPYTIWALGSDIYIYARYPILGTLIEIALKKAKFIIADGIDLARQTGKLAKRHCQFLPSASQMPHQSKLTVKKEGPLKLMFLGRMDPVKGLDVLIEAISKVKDLDFELHCLGDGSLLPSLKEKISDLGLQKKVVFYGNVNDPKLIYNRLLLSDWLVIPSRSDSIPLVFSESMKANLPVIVAEVGDMVELVKKYGVGFSFPREDSRKLAVILKDVIKKGRVLIRPYQQKTKKAAEIFDVNVSAESLLTMIQNGQTKSLDITPI